MKPFKVRIIKKDGTVNDLDLDELCPASSDIQLYAHDRKDKNNKDICEGDILQHSNGSTYTVEFAHNGLWMESHRDGGLFKFSDFCESDLEITGRVAYGDAKDKLSEEIATKLAEAITSVKEIDNELAAKLEETIKNYNPRVTKEVEKEHNCNKDTPDFRMWVKYRRGCKSCKYSSEFEGVYLCKDNNGVRLPDIAVVNQGCKNWTPKTGNNE